MITLKNILTFSGKCEDKTLFSEDEITIDCEGKLTLMPALIDPHVHFRTPGSEYKEDWITGAQAAIAGGVTQVFDMPNTYPATTTKALFDEKKQIIEAQLKKANIPLRFKLYAGASSNHLDTLSLLAKEAVGIKVFMGSTTGDLLLNTPSDLERVFQIAAQEKKIVSVHAEDEERLQARAIMYSLEDETLVHSRIRDTKTAVLAIERVCDLAAKYSTELLILHVSSQDELNMIQKARNSGIIVFTEATPHHLFFNESNYRKLGNKIKVNPPIRKAEDQEALWEAVNNGQIDMIGSDHAPHTAHEKSLNYKKAPAGIPSIELILPLLLTAYHEKKISLTKIIELTRYNIEQIFNLPPYEDAVLVDLNEEKIVTDEMLKTKCRWSPYAGFSLKGFPKYTICQGKVFTL